MDGGRVLRALLSAKLDRTRATRIAGTVGKVLAAVVVMVGLALGATMLAIIGVFVWFAAEQESATVAFTSLLASSTVADAMIREPHMVDAEMPIDDAAEQMIAEGQRELAVVERGRVAGIVTIADLAPLITAPQPHGAIGRAMHRDVPIVAPTTPLDTALEELERRGVLLIGDQDVIVGMLTTEQLAAFAALRQA
jgi:CBS domain-containing protein